MKLKKKYSKDSQYQKHTKFLKKIIVIVLEKRKTILPFIIKYFETDDEKESFF